MQRVTVFGGSGFIGRHLVARLAAEQGIRVLMVSHAPEDARRVADEVALVSQGALHPPQPTQGFFATPSKQLQAYLGDG